MGKIEPDSIFSLFDQTVFPSQIIFLNISSFHDVPHFHVLYYLFFFPAKGNGCPRSFGTAPIGT